MQKIKKSEFVLFPFTHRLLRTVKGRTADSQAKEEEKIK
jgi:hypothetical protein